MVFVAREAQWWLVGYDDTTVVAKRREWVRRRYSSSEAQWWLGYDDATVVAKRRGWVRRRYSGSEAQRMGTTTLQW